nr:tRNA guanosine(34) transglycosylase Tgt [Actinomyces minihominis]
MPEWITKPVGDAPSTHWPKPLDPFPNPEAETVEDRRPTPYQRDRGFDIQARSEEGRGLGRAGVIHTAHGDIKTPAFIPVGTKADVKGLVPEQIAGTGAQAVLANAYHLYLQPGSGIVDEAGGFGSFMHWPGPTFTDSGGFQVLSMGAGFKKVLTAEFAGGDMSSSGASAHSGVDAGPVAPELVKRQREAVKLSKAVVDEDGVVFSSHIDGSKHRFNPEISISIQHQLGADIMFAFDELTSLSHPRSYQLESLDRTEAWARRCLIEHRAQTETRTHRPYQQLWGVVQGADYQDLRIRAARTLGEMEEDGQMFDGFGIGGALRKDRLGEIVSWATAELPENKGRHLLGISEPFDLFVAVEAGIDTFDCVNPSRVARNAAIYTPTGRFNLTNARFARDFSPLVEGCGCYTCQNFTKAYVRHLFKAKEILASTLATIHNEWFTVRLVDAIREALIEGNLSEFREEMLGNFYGRSLNVEPNGS